ncbi:MAG TPA: sulfite exporter TauE/SafE family protein [Mycobacteriales bacterium]|nr:sulfite exporter TauE/SafE family protein [Mycobacteriales bacterium]
MHIDPAMSVAGLIVGIVVGLTGMGGGALMTPILVLFFHTSPSAAVSSDLVTSLFMKPIGGAVHWRRATVHKGIVRWLLLGAVPAAFAGVFVLNALGSGEQLQDRIKLGLGAALLLAFFAMVTRSLRRRGADAGDGLDTPVRVLPTLVIGVLGGLVVGMTSVGSGSMIIVALMWLYPRLSNRSLVGTDLVQAVPLVGAAALGHVLFGDVQLSVTTSLLIGSLPGVFIGAQISSRTTAPWLRPVLAAVLLASALKLLDVPSTVTAAVALSVAVVLLGAPAVVRRVRPARRPTPPRADDTISLPTSVPPHTPSRRQTATGAHLR